MVNSSQGGGSKDTWVTAGLTEPLGLGRAQPAATAVSPNGHSPARNGRFGPRQPVPGPTSARSGRNPSDAQQQQQQQQQGRTAITGDGDDMLSRIAESLFWIGRYVERAEDTARILDVHIHHLLEAP